MPAMMASTSLMVPEEQLARIQGLNQLLQGAMNIIAPPLGALLIEVLPLHGVLSVDIGTAALAILPLLFFHIPQPYERGAKPSKESSVWREMRDGMAYVWGWTGLRKVLILAVVINMISMPAFVLVPLLVKNEFGGGAMEIASMQSAWSVGFLLGGLLLSTWGGFRRKMTTVTLAMFGSAAGMLIVGVAPGTVFMLAVGGFLIAGLMNVLINGPAFALLQTIVDADMQGRVLALVISLANAMTPIGLAFAGPMAEFTGVRTWFILTSVVFVLSGCFVLINSDVRNIEDSRNEPAQARQTISPAVETLS